MDKKKIFICGISTECCSYSTLIQNENDFEILSGKKLLKYIGFNYSEYKNITFISSKFYRSLPGGPVDKNFFLKTIQNITDDLKMEWVKLPYGMVQKMIEHVHFSKKRPENWNIKLTNKKDKMIKVFTLSTDSRMALFITGTQ